MGGGRAELVEKLLGLPRDQAAWSSEVQANGVDAEMVILFQQKIAGELMISAE